MIASLPAPQLFDRSVYANNKSNIQGPHLCFHRPPSQGGPWVFFVVFFVKKHFHVMTSSCFPNIFPILNSRGRDKIYGRHFQMHFFNENVLISLTFSPKFVPKVQINNITVSVQIKAWHMPGAKPLSETMVVNLLTHICVTRYQWVKDILTHYFDTVYIWNCYSVQKVLLKVYYKCVHFMHYHEIKYSFSSSVQTCKAKWYLTKQVRVTWSTLYLGRSLYTIKNTLSHLNTVTSLI